MSEEKKGGAWWENESSDNGSDFYEMKVGQNKMRILTQFERVNSLFQGEFPNSKYVGKVADTYVPKAGETVTLQGWAWIIDRETGELKIGQFGKAILTQITALKNNPEYAFETMPMPYDITINNTGEGANRYSITPARQNTDITEVEMTALNKKKSIADILLAMENKQSKLVDYPEANSTNVPDKF
jgi:hypothetical protein